jgi:signal transduction histidine kinase
MTDKPWVNRTSAAASRPLDRTPAAAAPRTVLLSEDARSERQSYVESMGRVRVWFAAWGLDVLVVAAAASSAIGTVARDDVDRPDGPQLWFEAFAIGVVLLALCARRQLPFLAPAFVWVGCAALSVLDRQLITSQPGVFLCGMGAAALLGGLRSRVQSRAGLGIVTVCSGVVVSNAPNQDAADVVFTTALFVIAWLAGYALRDRVERGEAAEERAVRAEREQESAARVAVAEERARMARELHDVVAHAVSVMVLQVGAVRHRMPDASAEEEALRNVEQAGRTALAEMRRLLGALRQGGDLLELTPGPGLDDLQTLAEEVRAAGLDVRLHTKGEPVALPRSLDLSAYRIVQEGLTNALKHSGARRAEVSVDYAADEVRLEVRDDGPGGFAQNDGLGHGLIGIGERVKAYGGEMSAFASPQGGFVLQASIPLEEADG